MHFSNFCANSKVILNPGIFSMPTTLKEITGMSG